MKFTVADPNQLNFTSHHCWLVNLVNTFCVLSCMFTISESPTFKPIFQVKAKMVNSQRRPFYTVVYYTTTKHDLYIRLSNSFCYIGQGQCHINVECFQSFRRYGYPVIVSINRIPLRSQIKCKVITNWLLCYLGWSGKGVLVLILCWVNDGKLVGSVLQGLRWRPSPQYLALWPPWS